MYQVHSHEQKQTSIGKAIAVRLALLAAPRCINAVLAVRLGLGASWDQTQQDTPKAPTVKRMHARLRSSHLGGGLGGGCFDCALY